MNSSSCSVSDSNSPSNEKIAEAEMEDDDLDSFNEKKRLDTSHIEVKNISRTHIAVTQK